MNSIANLNTERDIHMIESDIMGNKGLITVLNNLIGEKIFIDFVGDFGYSINFGEIVDVTYDEGEIYLLNKDYSEFELNVKKIKNVNSTNMGCSIEYENIFLNLEVN